MPQFESENVRLQPRVQVLELDDFLFSRVQVGEHLVQILLVELADICQGNLPLGPSDIVRSILIYQVVVCLDLVDTGHLISG